MKHAWVIMAGVSLLGGCDSMPGAGGRAATATVEPRSGSNVRGKITFTQAGDRVRISGDLTGGKPGQVGFHIHEKGDCSAPDAMSAGGHFNPRQQKHGASSTAGHAGDLGNIAFDEAGRARITTTVDGISVSRDAPNGIIGRAVVVHMQQDDLRTDPTGNAGARAGCGVIG
jgi:superoxide dismutase, Cu-Zn family